MKTKNIFALATLVAAFAVSSSFAAPVFYPSGTEQPRIQFLKSINGSNFFIPGNPYGNRFPGYTPPVTEEKDPLVKPNGVTIAGGKVFVCDQNAGMVKIFDLDKKYVSNLGDVKGKGQLAQPFNIVVGADGTRYVTDGILRQVMVYDSKNLFVAAFGDSKKWMPSDLVLSKGNLYVTDLQNSQIVVVDAKTGKELNRFAEVGSGNGEIFKATNIAADTQGNLYVADSINGRVSVFSETGKFIRNYGKMGDQLGEFARPKGVAVDRENRVYAADAAFENIQIFNKEGQLLLAFGDVGNVPGGLNMPAKIMIDYDHTKYFADSVAPGYSIDYLILVASQFGDNKVNVYGFLKKK